MRKVKSKTENAHEQIIQESTTTQYGVSLKLLVIFYKNYYFTLDS